MSALIIAFLLATRIVVHDESQLPRFSYPVTTAPSELLTSDDKTFMPFAKAVEADIDRTLTDYDIQDAATLSGLLRTKLAYQLLTHDNDGARASIARLRELASKPDLKLLTGRLALAKLDADAQATSFAAADRDATNALPWSVVADTIKEEYAGERIETKDAIVGFVKHDLDPIAQKSGTLDGPSARELVRARSTLIDTLPLAAMDAPILHAYIAQHDVPEPDIWAARDVTVTPAQVKAPVVIGIWDSGVDPSDYRGFMYVDSRGRHGIAFADDGSTSKSYLYPIPAAVRARYPKYARYFQGFADLESAIDSPQARAVIAYQRSLSADGAAQLARDMEYVGEYAHGSHVAGIALRGNAGARILVARFDDDLPDLHLPPTMAWVKRMAANFALTAAYFRANHVRVVNISWSDTASEFEDWIARTDKITSAQARKQKAQRLFAVWRAAIEHVIATNPNTLFVAAAGNDDNNASFAQDVPSSLRYPNLLTVGATNQAGEATNFTSYGPTVAVYADGYHVASKLPGGYVVKWSGTSMASPNVVNLAGKLFALDPSLTAVEARALIIKGATRSADGKRMLIDPKRTVHLLTAASR